MSTYPLKALRRAGRFDITIHVPPPDVEARKAILQLELSKRATTRSAVDSHWLEAFARDHLEGYTGAEVVGVVQAAAELTRESNGVEIGRNHLLLACERLPPSTLEQYQTHLLRDIPEGNKSPSLGSPSRPVSSLSSSSHLYFFLSAILVAILAFVWLLIFHFNV